MSFIWHKFESMQQMRHVGVVAYVMKNVFNRAQKTDSDMIVIVELSSTAIKQLQPGCVHSARFFTSKAVTCSMSVRCVILLHLRLKYQLGGENFTENCLTWLVT